jgi:hypothetical protein
MRAGPVAPWSPSAQGTQATLGNASFARGRANARVRPPAYTARMKSVTPCANIVDFAGLAPRKT